MTSAKCATCEAPYVVTVSKRPDGVNVVEIKKSCVHPFPRCIAEEFSKARVAA
jgi:hypothetical protein